MPTIVITGANRGIGRALAEAYSRDGWDVVSTARHPAADLVGEGLALEATDQASIDALADRLAGRPIDILWNNAGVYLDKDVALGDLTAALWAETLSVNTIAPILIARALRANVAASGERKMLFTSSIMGSIANAGMGAYAYRSSKAALNMAVSLLSREAGFDTITCAALHPGWVRTDMGGPEASLSIEQSVAGLVRTAAGLDIGRTGGFFNHDGTPLPW